MSGKGSGRRPQHVDDQTVASNWARIFGKKAKPIKVTVPAPLPDEENHGSRAEPLEPEQV